MTAQRYKHNINKVVNKLTCIRHAELDDAQPNRSKYVFSCVCGKERIAIMFNVSLGNIKACLSCAKEDRRELASTKQNNLKHGMAGTPIYLSWTMMKQRCDNTSNPDYPCYGGRGISYDKQWTKFEHFYNDMKDTYFEGATLDKVNNNNNYCKANCQWLTRQANATKGAK